jgi:hypothetical protein
MSQTNLNDYMNLVWVQSLGVDSKMLAKCYPPNKLIIITLHLSRIRDHSFCFEKLFPSIHKERQYNTEGQTQR